MKIQKSVAPLSWKCRGFADEKKKQMRYTISERRPGRYTADHIAGERKSPCKHSWPLPSSKGWVFYGDNPSIAYVSCICKASFLEISKRLCERA